MKLLLQPFQTSLRQGHYIAIGLLLAVSIFNFWLRETNTAATRHFWEQWIYVAKVKGLVLESGIWLGELVHTTDPAEKRRAFLKLKESQTQLKQRFFYLEQTQLNDQKQRNDTGSLFVWPLQPRSPRLPSFPPSLNSYLIDMDALLSSDSQEVSLQTPAYRYLMRQLTHSPGVLTDLNSWVVEGRINVFKSLDQLVWSNWLSLILLICTLAFLMINVLRPLVKRLTDKSDELETMNASLQDALMRQLQMQSFLYESENKFKQLAQTAPVGIWLTDAEGDCIFVNQYKLDYLGCSLSDQLGKGWVHFIHPDDRERCFEIFQQARADNTPFEMDYRLVKTTGEAGWFQVMAKPLFDQEGRFRGFIGTSAEISNRKQMEEALQQLNTQLQGSNRELKLFTAVASHDLQEPLRKITAFSERLRDLNDSVLSETAQHYLLRIDHSVQRMQQLIHALLNYSKLSLNRQPFRSVSVEQVLQDVLSELEVSIQQSGARIEVVEALPVIWGDYIQIYQLLSNLLSNAIKYRHPDHPPVIQIRTLYHSTDGCAVLPGFCMLELCDNGIGFDTRYVDRIFEPFQRLHNHLAYEGTGMGLAICHKIVEVHGGRIDVTSQVGSGSQFRVQLPLSEGALPESLSSASLR